MFTNVKICKMQDRKKLGTTVTELHCYLLDFLNFIFTSSYVKPPM